MWKDELRKASFKGIDFFVEDHETEYGRRLVVNEYPFRDVPFTEDLGAAAQVYQVNAYILGEDYITARNALQDAVEQGGAGTLIHPYLGTKNVICQKLIIRETKRDGGYVSANMLFVPAGSRIVPIEEPAPIDLVDAAAAQLSETAKENFIESIIIGAVPEWVRDEFSNDLKRAAAIFKDIQKNGGINLQTSQDLINQAAVWVADVEDLANPSFSLIKNTIGIAERILNAFEGVYQLSPDAQAAGVSLGKFSEFVNNNLEAESALGAISKANSQTTDIFVKAASVAARSKAVVRQDFKSYEDAISTRQSVLDTIDSVSGAVLDDGLYNSLRELRKTVAFAVPGEEKSLPRITTKNLKKSIPALVLSYALYGSVDNEADIISRNKIIHPGFLNGGEVNILQNE